MSLFSVDNAGYGIYFNNVNSFLEVNLSSGWNLFTFTRNYGLEDRNFSKTLRIGHNLIGFSANESADFLDVVKINGSSWAEAVSSGWVLNRILEFNPIIGFYNFLLPSLSFERNKGYIIYAREEGLNLTLENVHGNEDIEFRLQNLRVKNTSSEDIFLLSEKAGEWFYSSNISEIIYKHNSTETNYTLVGANEFLNSWESYWVRSKVDGIELVVY